MGKVYGFMCPCNDCERRVVGCHGDCVAYKEWADSGVEEPKAVGKTPAHERIKKAALRHKTRRGKK